MPSGTSPGSTLQEVGWQAQSGTGGWSPMETGLLLTLLTYLLLEAVVLVLVPLVVECRLDHVPKQIAIFFATNACTVSTVYSVREKKNISYLLFSFSLLI